MTGYLMLLEFVGDQNILISNNNQDSNLLALAQSLPPGIDLNAIIQSLPPGTDILALAQSLPPEQIQQYLQQLQQSKASTQDSTDYSNDQYQQPSQAPPQQYDYSNYFYPETESVPPRVDYSHIQYQPTQGYQPQQFDYSQYLYPKVEAIPQNHIDYSNVQYQPQQPDYQQYFYPIQGNEQPVQQPLPNMNHQATIYPTNQQHQTEYAPWFYPMPVGDQPSLNVNYPSNPPQQPGNQPWVYHVPDNQQQPSINMNYPPVTYTNPSQQPVYADQPSGSGTDNNFQDLLKSLPPGIDLDAIIKSLPPGTDIMALANSLTPEQIQQYLQQFQQQPKILHTSPSSEATDMNKITTQPPQIDNEVPVFTETPNILISNNDQTKNIELPLTTIPTTTTTTTQNIEQVLTTPYVVQEVTVKTTAATYQPINQPIITQPMLSLGPKQIVNIPATGPQTVQNVIPNNDYQTLIPSGVSNELSQEPQPVITTTESSYEPSIDIVTPESSTATPSYTTPIRSRKPSRRPGKYNIGYAQDHTLLKLTPVTSIYQDTRINTNPTQAPLTNQERNRQNNAQIYRRPKPLTQFIKKFGTNDQKLKYFNKKTCLV